MISLQIDLVLTGNVNGYGFASQVRRVDHGNNGSINQDGTALW